MGRRKGINDNFIDNLVAERQQALDRAVDRVNEKARNSLVSSLEGMVIDGANTSPLTNLPWYDPGKVKVEHLTGLLERALACGDPGNLNEVMTLIAMIAFRLGNREAYIQCPRGYLKIQEPH